MIGDDSPPHLNHPGTENPENPREFHKKKTYFYSAKMAPKKVDKLITLKVAKLITLWRPKRGQTNNSPAHIYIYICIYNVNLCRRVCVCVCLCVCACVRARACMCVHLCARVFVCPKDPSVLKILQRSNPLYLATTAVLHCLYRFPAFCPCKNKHFRALSVPFCCRCSKSSPRTEFTLRSIFSTNRSFR